MPSASMPTCESAHATQWKAAALWWVYRAGWAILLMGGVASISCVPSTVPVIAWLIAPTAAGLLWFSLDWAIPLIIILYGFAFTLTPGFATIALLAGIATFPLIGHIHDWRHRRFLARTDLAWIASLAATPNTSTPEQQHEEITHRLLSRWDRDGRGTALVAAIPAILQWITAHPTQVPHDEARWMIGWMCEALQSVSHDGDQPQLRSQLQKLSRTQLALDRGLITPWRHDRD